MTTAASAADPANPLASLERKIELLITHCQRLSEENSALRASKESLSERIETAAARLEALMDRLPDDE